MVRNILVARDVMETKLITAYPTMTLQEAAKLFHDHKITGAPVVDRDGKLVGVVSQSDLVRYRYRSDGSFWNAENAAGMLYKQAPIDESRQVGKVMSPVVFSAKEDTPLRDVVRIMVRGRIHRIVILKDGKLCGIVTTIDILKRLNEWYTKGPERDLSD